MVPPSLDSPLRASEPAERRSDWPPELIGHSVLVRRARELARGAAAPASRALVVAEPGLDAGAVAAAIHRLGATADEPFVSVDCAAPDGRIEDRLFGRQAAGRSSRSDSLEWVAPGSLVSAARGGTLFLANGLDLPASAQTRLARALRDGEVRMRATRGVLPLDVRLIVGCGPAIDADVDAGAFRVDLFRRLALIRIDLPPLRLRPEDFAGIARHLAAGSSASGEANAKAPLRFTSAALGFLAALPWEGNLRELAVLVDALAARGSAAPVRVEDAVPLVRLARPLVPARLGSLREARRQFEREYIAAVLRQYGWKMGEAAQVLGIQRTNLYRKTRQLRISRAKATG